MTILAEASFAADRSAAARARRLVVAALEAHGFGDLAAAGELCVSELVTNAVLHARSATTVRVRSVGSTVVVEVSDASPVLPVRKRYSNQTTTGRGLMLLETFAADWGVEASDDGKTVWFVLDPAAPGGFADALDDAAAAGAAAVVDDTDLAALAARFSEIERIEAGDGPENDRKGR